MFLVAQGSLENKRLVNTNTRYNYKTNFLLIKLRI